jgi:hypothetical protein
VRIRTQLLKAGGLRAASQKACCAGRTRWTEFQMIQVRIGFRRARVFAGFVPRAMLKSADALAELFKLGLNVSGAGARNTAYKKPEHDHIWYHGCSIL